MAEQIDLTTPVTTPNVTNYRVIKLQLDRIKPAIIITLRDNKGTFLMHTYSGPTALNMLNVLNTANLTNNSMERRVLQTLINDGILVGTISGTPNL